MSEGCRLHNEYNVANPGSAHEEDPSKPGYTELGDAAGRSSNLAGQTGGPRAIWEGAVYHRLGLLNPRLRTTWFSSNETRACMGTLDAFAEGVNHPAIEQSAISPTVAAYPSPANGATEVPPEFPAGETPDPRAAVPGNPQKVGWLLSVNFNGPWYSDPGTDSYVTASSLTPDGGAAVPAAPQDTQGVNDWALYGNVGLFPYAPLAPTTWYTARLAGYIRARPYGGGARTDYPFDVTWRFRTGGGNSGTDKPVADGDSENTARRYRAKLSTRASLRKGRLTLNLRLGKELRSRKARVDLAQPKSKKSRRWKKLGKRRSLAMPKKKATMKKTYRISRKLRKVRVTVTVPAFTDRATKRRYATRTVKVIASRR